MKIQWISCGGIPLPIVSRWGLNKGARYSPKAPTVGTLQTLPGIEESFSGSAGQAAGYSFGTSMYLTPLGQPSAVQIGFPADLSLHAGVAAAAQQRDKLERLCHYIALPGM
jgi:hypothetical protein